MNSAAALLDYSPESSASLTGIKQWLVPVPKFSLVTEGEPARAEVESYIQAKFNKTYGANLASYLPVLMALRCADNLSGVAGIGLAAERNPLFLEHYLDAPIEEEIARISGTATGRERIAEIGNLVATTRGASRLVFIVLASALHRAGLEWMVFTATAPLMTSLRRLGFHFEPLKAADAARLPSSNTTDWGTYYAHAPMVVAGKLQSAMDLIASRTVYSTIQSLFDEQISELADLLVGA